VFYDDAQVVQLREREREQLSFFFRIITLCTIHCCSLLRYNTTMPSMEESKFNNDESENISTIAPTKCKMGSAGILQASAAERARIIGQQRQLSLKKRLSAHNQIRIMANDHHAKFTTPTMRQFSAPKIRRHVSCNPSSDTSLEQKKQEQLQRRHTFDAMEIVDVNANNDNCSLGTVQEGQQSCEEFQTSRHAGEIFVEREFKQGMDVMKHGGLSSEHNRNTREINSLTSQQLKSKASQDPNNAPARNSHDEVMKPLRPSSRQREKSIRLSVDTRNEFFSVNERVDEVGTNEKLEENSSPAENHRPSDTSEKSSEEYARVGVAEHDCSSLSSTESSVLTDVNSLNFDDHAALKAFLTSPAKGPMKCYIKRSRSGLKLYPEYRLYLKRGDRFLMFAKKKPKNRTSNYMITTIPDSNQHNGKISKDRIIGKLRSNFLGTEFQIFDSGVNRSKVNSENDGEYATDVRSELGAITYAANVLGAKGPRKMQVCLNKISEETGKTIKKWQSVHKNEEMLSCMKNKSQPGIDFLEMFANRPPRWNENVGAYVLNFNGRVTMASVKNFQLIKEYDESERIILQFGRCSDDEFTMDLDWPMTPLQAFAISLSSFDSKIACD